MTFAQKFFGGIFLIATILVATCNTPGTQVYNVKVKYKDNLVSYSCKDKSEYYNILLKSRNDILFYDGEYFYDQAPTNKKDAKCKVVDFNSEIVGGNIDSDDYYRAVILLILLTIGITFLVKYLD